jgi:hypothetical protein
VSIPALFTIARLWKFRCLTTGEWIKKMWCIYTVEFYSAIRKNDSMGFEGQWMQLEDIVLSEVSQTQKHKGHHVFSHP